MLHQVTQMAFAVRFTPGAYALLLGAGISVGAAPTAWQIVEELIDKLANTLGQTAPDDPEKWYEKQFGKPPSFDGIIEQIAGKSSVDKQKLLSSYFKFTAADRQDGKGVPTQAHKAIAELVERGYIKLIITTNFDSLLEEELKARGISVTVLSKSEQFRKQSPIQHNQVTVAKIHGDYMDDHLRATADDLSNYDADTNDFIADVLSKHGLIICGWSAEHDTALRLLIQTRKQEWYSYHWIEPGTHKTTAKLLAELINANVIPLTAIDAFTQLSGALDSLERPPVSRRLDTDATVEYLKRLVKLGNWMEIEDMFLRETESLFEELSSSEFKANLDAIAPQNHTGNSNYTNERTDVCFRYTERLSRLLVALIWYTQENSTKLITSIINRTYEIGVETNPYSPVHLFPAAILIYSAGIAAVMRDRWKVLEACISSPVPPTSPLAKPLKSSNLALLYGVMSSENNGVALSMAFHNSLRKLYPNIPSDRNYTAYFDQFEMLLYCAYAAELGESEVLTSLPRFVADDKSYKHITEFWRYVGRQRDLKTHQYHPIEEIDPFRKNRGSQYLALNSLYKLIKRARLPIINFAKCYAEDSEPVNEDYSSVRIFPNPFY